jgi:hypothetical protein
MTFHPQSLYKGFFGSQNQSYCFVDVFKRLIFVMAILRVFLEEESVFEILIRSVSLYKRLNYFTFIPRRRYGLPICNFGFILSEVCILVLPAGECSCLYSLTASGRADHLPHGLLFLGLCVVLLCLSGPVVLQREYFL